MTDNHTQSIGTTSLWSKVVRNIHPLVSLDLNQDNHLKGDALCILFDGSSTIRGHTFFHVH